MITRFFLFGLLLIGVANSAYTQDTWSLNDCIAYALEHNIDIKKVDLNLERNEENYSQQIRNFLPTINAGVGFRPNFGKSIDPNTNDVIYDPHFSNTYSAGTSVSIFQGFRRLNNVKYAKIIIEAGLYNKKSFERVLSFKIMDAFYNALFYKKYILITEALLNESLWNKKYVDGMIRNGLRAESDVLSVEAEIASAELTRMKAQHTFEQATLSLKRLINLDVNQPLIIGDENLDFGQISSNPGVESLYSIAVLNHPDIKSMQAKVATSLISLKNAKAYIYPTLGLGANVYTGFYQTVKDTQGRIIPFADQFRDNANQYLNVSIGIPIIYNRGQSRSQIKLAGINLRESELNLQNEKQNLYQNIQQDLQKMIALEKEIEQGRIQVKASEAAEKTIKKKFEKGLANQYELSQARNVLAKAKSNLMQTKIQYEISLRTIEYYQEY